MKRFPLSLFALLAVAVPIQAAEMTPEQLAKTVLAFYEKYETLSCEYQMNLFRYNDDGSLDPSPASTVEGAWKATTERCWERNVTTSLDVSEPGVTDLTSARSPSWSKQLNTSPTLLRPSTGSVASPEASGPVWMAYDVLLNRHDRHWEAVSNDKASVARDEASGNLLLKAELLLGADKAFQYEAEIAPGYGYMPIRTKLTPPDSKAVFLHEAKDIRELEKGIWLPFKVRHDVTGVLVNEYEVLSAKVNLPIPNEEMDIVFPEGTRVDDQFAGVRYEVSIDQAKGTLLDDRPLSPQDLKALKPVPDATLERGFQNGRIAVDKELPEAWNDNGILKKSGERAYVLSIAAGAMAVAAAAASIVLRRKSK